MKLDREKIEREYVTTNISYRRLAEKYETNFNTIKILGKKYNWVEKRKKYNSKLTQKYHEKSINDELDLIDYLHKATGDILQTVVNHIQNAQSDKERLDYINAFAKLRPMVLMNKYDTERINIEKEKLNIGTEETTEQGIVYMPAVIEDDTEAVVEGENVE